MTREKFRLERVLRVRALWEEEARAAWAVLDERARAEEARHAALLDEQLRAQRRLAADRPALRPAAVVLLDQVLDRMQLDAARLRERAHTLRFQADGAFIPYTERRRERRSLERLKERARRAGLSEERRADAALMDETAVQRAARRRRAGGEE